MRWLFRFFRKSKLDAQLDAELRFHIEQQTAEHIANGIPPAEARRRAFAQLGGMEYTKEECREARGAHFIESLSRDIHFALRMLRKSPGFTAVAVLTLALGIGANTAIFSMVDLLTLRLPPIANPGQVVTLAYQNIDGSYGNGFSYPDYAAIRSQSTAVFSSVAASMDFQMDGLSTDGESQSILVSYVTGNYFELIGLKPAIGNFFASMPGKSGNDEPVLVLGYSFWKAHFGGDPRVIGKAVRINGHPVTIIGVTPRGFHGLTPILNTEGYLPLGMAAVTSDAYKDFLTSRSPIGITVTARLKLGATLARAQPALTVIAHRLFAQYPTADKWRNLVAYALGPMSPVSDPSGPQTMRLMSALFLTLAGLVLLLACLNVANLLLVRASGRQREMAVRAAVGGGRSRLIRQLLTESLLLALLGCVGGVLLGQASSRWLGSINPRTSIPFVFDFQLDWRVFAYAFSVALLTALLVGIAPALRATRGNLNRLLHESARTTTAGHQRTRSILVVAQVGGSLMLLIIAGLFVRSLQRVEHTNLGFDPNYVVNFTIDAHQTGYNETQSRNFLKSLLPQVRALPGVETATLAATVPMGYTSNGMEFKIDGHQPPAGQSALSAGSNAVASQYFETMRIPILRGRAFLDSDTQTAPHVAVINQAMAEKYWHGENPIGQHFTNTDDPKNSIEVVGVAANSRTGDDFSSAIEPYLYVPLAQHYDYQMPVTLQLRTSLPLAAMNREVVDAIHALASAMPVTDIQTMREALDTLNGLMLFQIGAGLAAALGILGLALAVVGVYGVVSYGASQRTHEIGIRMALGAQPADVLRMILRQGFFIVGAGLIAGILAAAAMARLVGNFLAGVSPLDPLTYASASILLAAVALLACYLPARRAMRVDPMVALHYE